MIMIVATGEEIIVAIVPKLKASIFNESMIGLAQKLESCAWNFDLKNCELPIKFFAARIIRRQIFILLVKMDHVIPFKFCSKNVHMQVFLFALNSGSSIVINVWVYRF